MFVYINFYDSNNFEMDFKGRKSASIPHLCEWQQYEKNGKEPFFDENSIFMEGDL